MAELVASISLIWDSGNARVLVVVYCGLVQKTIDEEKKIC